MVRDDLVVLDDELVEEVVEGKDDWLVVDEHQEFEGYWTVDSLDPGFFSVFEDLIGRWRALWPPRLDEFLSLAGEHGYRVGFGQDPQRLLERHDRLCDPPPFELNSTLPDTVGGFLPYQLKGFNWVKDVSGGAVWSTGTGKVVLGAGLLKYHQVLGQMDLGLFVAKDHNTINVTRSLQRLADIDSILLGGTPKKRIGLYAELLDRLESGERDLVVVTNYEKLREDEDVFKELVTDREVCVVWDEMPAKLKNRRTQLYQAIARVFYLSADTEQKGTRIDEDEERPASLLQWMATATPIENSPEDYYNCMRLIRPRLLGTTKQFNKAHVAKWNYFNRYKPEKFKDLDRIKLKTSCAIHVADKENDPEVAKYFPKKVKEPYYIDWDRRDRLVYDLLADELTERARARARGDQPEEGPLSESNVLGMIGVMQMLCDAPTLVAQSAENRRRSEALIEEWADDGDPESREPMIEGSMTALSLLREYKPKLANDRHTKLATLKMLLTERHADDKSLVYTAYGERTLLPILSAKLDDWGVSHVVYGGSRDQRQDAQDRFRADDSIQTFLSSDKGSDSLDLEVAQVGVNYDKPWTWAREYQRENRNDRVITPFDELYWYDLLMADSVEDRRVELIFQKYGYHRAVFQDGADENVRGYDMEDLLYILTGQSLEDLLA